MANNFEGTSQAVQDYLQGACCYDLCPPTTEVEDNQFLALVLYGLSQALSIDPTTADPVEVNQASQDAWCELNMATLCSIPPDKIKALILWAINEALAPA